MQKHDIHEFILYSTEEGWGPAETVYNRTLSSLLPFLV
jgi:hypothetical protein